jgi:hypothetical protein
LIVVDVQTGERRIIDGDGAAADYVRAIPGSLGDRA